jgi:hypothetical protein
MGSDDSLMSSDGLPHQVLVLFPLTIPFEKLANGKGFLLSSDDL